MSIILELYPERFNYAITDNGKGFDTGTREFRRNFVINIMRERAGSIDASLDISSSPGKGSNVSLSYIKKK